MKEFIPKSLDCSPQRNLNLATKNFEEWEYSSSHDVGNDAYLAAFLATWLNGRAFGDSLTSIRPETFWVSCDMALGKRYNLAVHHLAWAYNRLGAFKGVEGQISRKYRPWALITGWLGCYFPRLTAPSPGKRDSPLTSIRVWLHIRRLMPRILLGCSGIRTA